MGSGDSDREANSRRRPEGRGEYEPHRDRERDRRERDRDRDRDRTRRRDRIDGSHDDDGSRRRYEEPRRRDRREDKGERDGREEDSHRRHRDRRPRDNDRDDDRDDEKEDRHRRERRRSRSPDSSRKRQRREDSEEHADRRRRTHRDRRRDSPGEQDDDSHRRRRRRDYDDVNDNDEASGHDGDDRDRWSERGPARPPIKQRGPLPDQAESFAVVQRGGSPGDAEVKPPKEKPNFGNTGVLAAASNAVAQADGSVVTLKYHEPPEARKPSPRDQWTLFVFKDGAIADTISLGARSCWLVGRDAAVADLLAAHPSVSKQHAVLQFRFVEKRNEFGDRVGRVKPYLLDLASANGTTLNGDPVPAQRYLELRDKDLVRFGHSGREYVLMLAPKE